MLPGDHEIPVFLFRDKRGYGVVAYALLHEGKLIQDPVSYQINEVISQLFLPKKAMTLFYVSDKNSPASDKFNRSSSASILAAAIKSFNLNEAVGIKN